MQDNNYPGILRYSEEKTYRPPLYSSRDFEKLIAMPAEMDHDPEGFNLLLEDLQSNILLHHQRNHSRCYFLHFNNTPGNAARALAWIRFIAEKMMTAKAQLEDTALNRKNRKFDDRLPVINFYLTWKGYAYLGLEHLTPFDERGVFEKGINASMPSFFKGQQEPTWSPGGLDLHAMLMIAQDSNKFKDVFSDLDNNSFPGTRPEIASISQDGFLKRTEDKKHAIDWFGYRDGISQPLFFAKAQGAKQNDENNLASLGVVLTKDRGGRNKYSAGSYLACMKIEQDPAAFADMQFTIAAHTAVYGIEACIAGKKIDNVVDAARIERLIKIAPDAQEELNANLPKIMKGLNLTVKELQSRLTSIINSKSIAEIIAENEVGKLISISLEDKMKLVKDIVDIVDKNKSRETAQFNDIAKSLKGKIELLKNDTGIALLNAHVIEKMIEKIAEGMSIDKLTQETLHAAIDNAFTLDHTEKRKLVDSLKETEMISASEIKNIVDDNVHLAEAYIMGRFRNGAPVTRYSVQGNRKIADDNFSYSKKLVSNEATGADDSAAIRCPFAAHARKANPRDDRQRRLIARRGVLYQEKPVRSISTGKGMLFMSFQANLVQQFEYILKNWINNVYHGHQMTGVDLLAGTGINRDFSRWYFPINWNDNDPDAKVLLTANELKPCIKYLKGAYFFAPSISFLKNIDQLSTYKEPEKNARTAATPPPKPVFDGYPVKPVKVLRGIIEIIAPAPGNK